MSDPTLIASRYRIVRELGRGGMGVVYVVEHTRTGDQLALKLLHGRAARDPQSIERFKREARASARIRSENVVKVVDADVAPELENAPFLVMELLDGSDLEKQVRARGRLPPAEVCALLGEAARALDRSHSVGIVHRDLKPENLFVHRREDGSTVLKILDFGISKIVGGEADMTGAGMTSTGAIMGTPLYMAPEQAHGRVSEIGPATDVWAIGLIAVYLLTAEVYWRANTLAELMVHIVSEPLYPPTQRWPWLPREIDSWFARSCARDPRARFASVGEQVEMLAAALGLRRSVVPGPIAAPQLGTAFQPTLPVTSSAPRIPGARTTSATASEGVAPRSNDGRVLLVIAMAILLLAGTGTTAWVIQRRFAAHQGPPGAASVVTSLPAAAVVPTSTSTTPATTAVPSVMTSAAATASMAVEAGVAPAAASENRGPVWRPGQAGRAAQAGFRATPPASTVLRPVTPSVPQTPAPTAFVPAAP